MENRLSRFSCLFALLLMIYLTLIIRQTIGICKPFHLKRDNLNSRLKDHGFHESTLDLHNCVRFCWYLTACKSLDYDRGTMTCKLNDADRTSVQVTEFETIGHAVYSDIMEWPQEIAGPCGSRPCSPKQLCLPSSPPRCIDISCGDLKSIKNGNIELVNPGEVSLLDEAIVVCNTGHVVENPISKCSITDEFSELFSRAQCFQTDLSSVYCHIKGEWDEKTCDPVDCGPPTVDNGYATLIDPSNTTYLAQAVVTCIEGYETSILNIKCQADGTWSAATCAKISCGNLPSIPKGVTNLSQDGANLYLDTATLQCEFGYIATPSIFKCMSSKSWEAAECACMPPGNYKGTLSRTIGGYFCQRWDSQFPHGHIYTHASSYPDSSVSAAADHCRAVGENYLWCYVTDWIKRWDYCTKPSYVC